MPVTSAPQASHASAKTSRFEVGFGCSGRCAPACGLALRFGDDGSDGFRPDDGGWLELSGVFGGRPSFNSSSATRATSTSIRAIKAAIKASLSAKSGGGVTHRLTHIRRHAATKNDASPAIARRRQAHSSSAT